MKAALALALAAAALAAVAARELQQYSPTPTQPAYSSPSPTPAAYSSPSPTPAAYSSPSPTPAAYSSPSPTPAAYYPPYSYTPAPPADVQQWQKDAMKWVNDYYRWGGKWPLNWDYSLKASCEANAAEAATKYYYAWNKFPGEYAANSLPPWGQTAWKVTNPGQKPGWQVAVEGWYAEGAAYQNGYSAQTSNYTQLTWKASTGWWICTAKDQYDAVYYYAHYLPVGNVKGYYADNVPPYAPVQPATGK